MFAYTKAFSGFSVDDIAKAKEFYGGTLGIPVSEEKGMLFLQIAGDTTVLVYRMRITGPRASPFSISCGRPGQGRQ
ncbi:hypothetical protein [Streptomyces sp. NPDC002889]|uniref:hypothetical protein n=1 Tax=Streptomyces sp. NPDC002889 TaxID=3364669 RepID=UPI0036A232DF